MKSTCRNFFSCWFIAAVLGLLTIFANQSVAAFEGGLYNSNMDGLLRDSDMKTFPVILEKQHRQLMKKIIGYAYLKTTHVGRRLEETGEDEDATPSNLLHINLKELSSLFDCQYGCTAEFALVTSDQCNSTDALNSGL